jgi:hypothetical protein
MGHHVHSILKIYSDINIRLRALVTISWEELMWESRMTGSPVMANVVLGGACPRRSHDEVHKSDGPSSTERTLIWDARAGPERPRHASQSAVLGSSRRAPVLSHDLLQGAKHTGFASGDSEWVPNGCVYLPANADKPR